MEDILIFTIVRPYLKIACMYFVHGVHQKNSKKSKKSTHESNSFL